MTLRTSLAWGLAVLVSSAALAAQAWDGGGNADLVPPTAEVRQAPVSDELVARGSVESLVNATIHDPSGVTITVAKVRSGEGADLLWQIRWDPGKAWGPGTWVAFRDGLGRLRELRIILLGATPATDLQLDQPGSWVRLVPKSRGTGCTLDLFIAGRLVTGGWTVPASLLDILRSDDDWLWKTTDASLHWESLLPLRRWEDERVEAFHQQVHKALSSLPFSENTLWWPDPSSSVTGATETGAPAGAWKALDDPHSAAGRGLGPWGVTLWAATGIVRGWGGPWYTWNDLNQIRSHLPGYSAALAPDDPTKAPGYALDWIRNLGLGVDAVLHPSRPHPDDASDIHQVPFLTALPRAGFSVNDMPALVHLLAVSQPGTVYLASLSYQENLDGASSAVRYEAPALMIPWVGDDQHVHVAFFAGPQELTWSQWIGEYPAGTKGVRPDHVALVALPLPSEVPLPLLPNQ